MPNKRSGQRRSSPGGRLVRVVRSPSAELARLRGPFLAWLTGQGLPAPLDSAAVWDDVEAVVARAADRAGLIDLSAWTAAQIHALADGLDDEEAAALPALPLLLAFLADTGRWRGTPEQFEQALAAAQAASPVVAVLAELAAVAAVAVDPAREDAALRALPVIGSAEALLRWLAPRRRLTGTGALRRADVAGAAGLLGVELAGRGPRSMWDVPRLAELWQALHAAGLLEITATAAAPTPLALGWLVGDA